MGQIASAFEERFRDFNTDGVSSSGAYKPSKALLRALGAIIEQYALSVPDFALTAAPDTAPIVADSGVAGVLTGRYCYGIAYESPAGVTDVGPVSLGVAVSAKKIALSLVPVSDDETVTRRYIYRTVANPTSDYDLRFLATIDNNVDTSYLDNADDGALTGVAATINVTGGVISLNGDRFISSGRTTLAIGVGAIDNGPNSAAYSIAIGAQALAINNVGSKNIAIGYAAMGNNTAGESNVALGFNALYANSTGSVNTALGGSTLSSNTTGHHNTAVHTDAAVHNTTGNFNVGVGYDAYHFNTTGGGQTAIGYQSLYGCTTGNTNIGLGFQSGVACTTGSNNIFIGANADTSDGTISNAIAIGLNVTASASNQIKIGNSSHVSLVLPALAVTGLASLTASGVITANGQLIGKGTATNDDAAAGYLGEQVESEIASGSAVSLVNGTAKDVATISLTAGDWDVEGDICLHPAATTVLIAAAGWIGTTANTYPGLPNKGATARVLFPSGFVPNDEVTVSGFRRRLSLSGTTTISLGAIGYFTTSSLTAYGYIRARRVR
jgi:hypothetical protein